MTGTSMGERVRETSASSSIQKRRGAGGEARASSLGVEAQEAVVERAAMEDIAKFGSGLEVVEVLVMWICV